jgi:transposase InsO family protein
MSSRTRPPPSTRCSSRACKHALPGKGQTDFTYFKIIRWCWYYLSTILDCYSRYIIAWKLCTNMRAEDVTNKIELALTASGCDQAVVRHKPCLLSDNGSCYISGDLAKWLEVQKMDHVRGAPFHPQTQGKIERWRQTMKNSVLLKITYCPVILSARSGLRRISQQPAIPRELEQRHTRQRLLRPRQSYT